MRHAVDGECDGVRTDCGREYWAIALCHFGRGAVQRGTSVRTILIVADLTVSLARVDPWYHAEVRMLGHAFFGSGRVEGEPHKTHFDRPSATQRATRLMVF